MDERRDPFYKGVMCGQREMQRKRKLPTEKSKEINIFLRSKSFSVNLFSLSLSLMQNNKAHHKEHRENEIMISLERPSTHCVLNGKTIPIQQNDVSLGT